MSRGAARRAAGIVGLACYWPYMRRFEFEHLFAGYAMPSAMWTAYTIVTWLNVALLVACALRCDAVARWTHHGFLGIAAGALNAAGAVVLVATPVLGAAAEPVGLGVGSLLLSLGFCGLTVAWMSWLACDGGTRALEDALLSFALCSFLLLSSLLPAAFVMVRIVAAPLVSGALWAYLRRSADPATAPSAAIAAFKAEKPPASLLVAVILLFVIGCTTAGLIHFDEGTLRVIERTASVAISCVILAAIYVTARNTGQLVSMVRKAWLALVVAFLAGESVVVLFGGVVQEIGMAVFWASLSCLEVLILAVMAMWCNVTGRSAIAVLGVATVLLRVIPGWVGKFAAPACMEALGIAPASMVGGFVVASSLLLVSATLLFLNAMVESGSAAGASLETRAHAVDRLTEAYLLTPREADVLGLLLQGLSYQAIADRLQITLGTVQTHTKGLYRKMDVHSRDELVARAEE